MLSKEKIISLVWNPVKKRMNPNYLNIEKMKIYFIELKESLDFYKKDYIWCESYKEICFCMIHDITVTPICKFCEEKVLFKGNYKTYCKLHSREETKLKTIERCTGFKQSEETKLKRSNSNKGQKRSNQTKTNISNSLKTSIKAKDQRERNKKLLQTPIMRQMMSEKLKRSISEGKFTPNITNTWTHFNTIIDNKKFRSSFEGIFYIYSNLFLNNKFEFETLRIPYIGTDNKVHTYIVDFIDHELKKIIEVKPSCYKNNIIVNIKEKALKQWSISNQYEYEMINENDIFKYFNLMNINGFYHEFLDEFKEKYYYKLKDKGYI